MEDNSTTYTTIIDVEVQGEGEVKNLGESVEQNDEKFKSLRAQIRETTVALQALADQGKEDTKEFQTLRSKLDDLNDAQERVAFQAGQFDDQLSALPGPLGQVGQGVKSFNDSMNQFSTGFKVALGVVGLVVSAFMALKESLSRTEEGQKKLTQITESFTKILNGVFAIIEPIAMALADLVIQFLSNDKVLNVLSKTFAGFAAILKGTLTIGIELVKFVTNNFINAFKTAAGVLTGFGEILKGAFTFDLDLIKKGVSDVGKTISTGVDSFVGNVKDRFNGIKDGVKDAFVGAEDNFKKGTKRLTELEKKNAEEAKKKREEAAKAAKEAREKALQERLKYLETIDKLDEAELDKEKEKAIALQQLEEEKLLKENEIQKERVGILEKGKSEELSKLSEGEREKLSILENGGEETILTTADIEKQRIEILSKGEEDRLNIEKAFATKSYELRKKDLEDKRALYPKSSNEYKSYTAELIKLDSDYIKTQSEFSKRYTEILNKRAEEKKKALEKELADVQTYNDKLFEIGNAAIKNEEIRAEATRLNKYYKDKEALEKSFVLVKASEEEKAVTMKLLEQGLQNDLDKIHEDARKKENDKLIKDADDKLKLLQIVNESLIEGTKAYFENRAQILNEAEAKELLELDLTEAQKTAIKDKYVKLRKQLDDDEIASYGRVASATMQAIGGVFSALASGYDEEAKTSKEAFEKRKKLQKATAIMSAASGIIQILTQPSTLPSPLKSNISSYVKSLFSVKVPLHMIKS